MPESHSADGTHWPWKPDSVRTMVVNTILAVAILATVTALALPGGSSDDLAAPSTMPDPVPAGRVIQRYRSSDCGVTTGTLNRLVPRAEPRHSLPRGDTCRWRSAYDDKRVRGLTVSIQLTTPQTQTLILTTDPLAKAIDLYSRALPEPRLSPVQLKPVSGLGDEAVASHSTDPDIGGSQVVFRAGTAVVQIEYRAAERKERFTKQLVPEAVSRAGALKAAAEVARSLGIPVSGTPGLAPATPQPPMIQRALEPCDMVPKGLARKLVPKNRRGSSNNEHTFTATCTWSSEGGDYRKLTVAVTTYPDKSTRPATATAIRDYLIKHLSARATEPISASNERYFRALRGLGDEAFCSYVEETAPGRVVFRSRNVVADITYDKTRFSNPDPGENRPLTKQEATRGAYTAAREVAKFIGR